MRSDYSDGDVFSLTPGVEGEKHLLLCLYMDKTKKNTGGVVIRIVRQGSNIFRRKYGYKTKKMYVTLSQRFQFQRKDRIDIKMSDSGNIVVRDPLIYTQRKLNKATYVFIVAPDNLRNDRIGKRRNGVELTPWLNRFITRSVLFRNCVSQSSWTLPAFMSLFTGLYAFKHDAVRASRLPDNVQLLTNAFGRRFVLSSINGGIWVADKVMGHRGFDIFMLGSLVKDPWAARTMFEAVKTSIEKSAFPALFMFMHTYSIHSPFNPPEEFLYQLEQNPKHKILSNFSKKDLFKTGVTESTQNTLELLYDAEVLAFDDQFGRFMEWLKARGIYDDSLIVFVSDHGEEFYEHRGWFHGHSQYGEMIRIPLVIKFPGNQYAGRKVESRTGIIDVLPTVADYLGVQLPEKLDGKSLMQLIRDDRPLRDHLFSTTTAHRSTSLRPRIIAILKENFKFICNLDNLNDAPERHLDPAVRKRGSYELYDLALDPGEKNNLATKRPALMVTFKGILMPVLKWVKTNVPATENKRKELSETEKKRLKTLGYL
jgi:arylsulfatase A-like enzyme